MKIYGRHHHNCENPWDEASPRELELAAMSLYIIQKLENIMATLDETLAAVTSEDTKIDSIIAYNTGIKKQLDEVLAGASLPPGVQAKVDAIFNQANASAGKIDAALSAGVPPA